MRWKHPEQHLYEVKSKFLWFPRKLPVNNIYGELETRWLERANILCYYSKWSQSWYEDCFVDEEEDISE